jgi:predicted ATPase
LKLLRALARGELQVFVENAGRANDVLHRSIPQTKVFEVGLAFRAAAEKCHYGLLAKRTDDDRLLIRSETIERFGANGNSIGTEGHHNPTRESVLSLSPPAHLPGERVLFPPMQLLQGLRVFHFTETAVSAPAAYECDFSDNRELREDGGNLAAYLFYLLNYAHTAYQRIIATIRQALPGFGDFVLEPSRQNPPKIRLRWRMKGMEGDYGAHQLSDGTLRFILLATLLGQPLDHLPKIVAIDEPELGLHPAALNLAGSLIRIASHHCQMIVATQSAALVDSFEADDIIVVHRQERASTLERLSEDRLKDWLDDYTLGQLWEKNVIGGGPVG